MPAKAVQDLFKWKIKFLQDQIDAIDAKIKKNNKEIAKLEKMPDTRQQISSLKHRNEGLDEDRKEIEDELKRFKNGGDGKKINMARRNIGNEIHRLQKEAGAALAKASG